MQSAQGFRKDTKVMTLRKQLMTLLGIEAADLQRPSRWATSGQEELRDHTTVSHGTVEAEAADGLIRLPGICLAPSKTVSNGAAILYCHAHGDRYGIGAREMIDGRPALLDPPTALVLAEAGYTVLCIDMPCFGQRQDDGVEPVVAKAALWQGKPLFGRQIIELTLALTALSNLPGVDPARVGAFGLSMGATHAYWLTALADRVAAAAHLCAFADIAPLIETGAHDLHGLYMTVPGLLAHGDMGDVAALIAPRPQLVGWGTDDPLTPPQAITPAVARLGEAYRAAGVADRLITIEAPGSGHKETAAMRAAVLGFFERHLAG